MGHRHITCMLYQCNIMGTLIYPNMTVSQSCPRSFYAIPIFPLKFPKFFIYLSPIFFLELGTCILLFCSYLVANVLANRARSLRLSNTLLQHQLFVYYIVPILLFVELLLIKYSKVVPGATIYKITRLYLNSYY